ncbi:MAG: hypothetical protein ACYTG4_00365 [Planctomycetota bacterium]|jgi:hypothetical protein
MIKRAAAAMLLAALGGLTACASAPDVDLPEIQDLSFMLGSWSSGRGDLEVRIEFFMKSEHRMAGTTQIFSDDRLAYFEESRIEFNPLDVRLHVVTKNGAPRSLTLGEHGQDFAVFENSRGDGLQRIEYRKAAAGALDVTIQGLTEGRPFQRRWEMQRPTFRDRGGPLTIGIK